MLESEVLLLILVLGTVKEHNTSTRSKPWCRAHMHSAKGRPHGIEHAS